MKPLTRGFARNCDRGYIVPTSCSYIFLGALQPAGQRSTGNITLSNEVEG